MRHLLLIFFVLSSVSAWSYDLRVKKVTSFTKNKVRIKKSGIVHCTIRFDSWGDINVIPVKSGRGVKVMDAGDGIATLTVKEVSGSADVSVSGTRDLILAAGACPKAR